MKLRSGTLEGTTVELGSVTISCTEYQIKTAVDTTDDLQVCEN